MMPKFSVPGAITIPGLGVEVPVPRWTYSVFGVIAVVAVAFGAYRYFYPVERELVSVKQANHMLRLEVAEYNRHIVDVPTITLSDAYMKVLGYEDGCVLVSTKFAGRATTRLLVEPGRADATHKEGDEAEVRASLLPALHAAQSRPPSCLNPHPGPFQSTYGERTPSEPCWIAVWRAWPDGYLHYQMLNTCTNNWASNQDGSPKVTWTKCVH